MISYLKGFIKNLTKRNISILSLIDSRSEINRLAKINRDAKIVNSKIGRYSYIGGGSWVVGSDIGSFCSIACNTYIGLAGHTIDLLSTSPIFTEPNNGTGHSWVKTHVHAFKNKRTVVGSDVWIGYGAKIISGVSIGHGAVIAAGAVVTKDVPPYAVVGGVPAKIIRFRFSEPIISELLNFNWWDLPDEKLKDSISIFHTADVDKSLIYSIITPPQYIGLSNRLIADSSIIAHLDPIQERRCA